MSLVEYWRENTWLPRAALVLALLSSCVLAGTTIGLTATGPFMGIFALHIAVMILMAVVFARITQHHALVRKVPLTPLAPVWIPGGLKVLTVLAFLVLAFTFFMTFYTFGEGSLVEQAGQYMWVREGSLVRPISLEEARAFNRMVLQVFALAWLFFSLLVAWVGHVVTSRVAQMRRLVAQPAA